MANAAARFFLKVYDKTGATLRQTIGAEKVISVPTIVRTVSACANDIKIALAFPWDDFGFGASNGIDYGDLVKVYAVTSTYPSGYLVYTGFVTEIEAIYDPTTNHIVVRLFPLDMLLNATLGPAPSYGFSFASNSIKDIWTSLISQINSSAAAAYLTSALDNDALSLTLSYPMSTCLQVITDAFKNLVNRGFAPATTPWYWRIEPNGQVDLHTWNNATADHRFTIGKDVQALDVIASIMNLENQVAIEWTETVQNPGPPPSTYTVKHYNSYEDATSIAAYGRRAAVYNSSSITSASGSDAAGPQVVNSNKEPTVKTILTVNAQYAIEKILPGDTCVVRNMSTGGELLLGTTPMQIMRVEYDGMVAHLHLNDIINNFGTELLKAITAATQ